MSWRDGIKWLFLGIWDELKTLIFLPSLNQNKSAVSHQSKPCKEHGGMTNPENPVFHIPSPEIPKTAADNGWNKTPIIERIRFAVEIIAVFIALYLARVYYVQMQANLRQAAASERQLEEMHQNSIIEERPWMLNVTNHINIQFTANGEIESARYYFKFRNFGKTPALNIQSIGGWSTILTSALSHTATIQSPDRISLITNPNEEANLSDNIDVPSLIYVLHNKVPFYVVAVIWYEDAFGKKYWTRCGMYVGVDLKENFKKNINDCDANNQ